MREPLTGNLSQEDDFSSSKRWLILRIRSHRGNRKRTITIISAIPSPPWNHDFRQISIGTRDLVPSSENPTLPPSSPSSPVKISRQGNYRAPIFDEDGSSQRLPLNFYQISRFNNSIGIDRGPIIVSFLLLRPSERKIGIKYESRGQRWKRRPRRGRDDFRCRMNYHRHRTRDRALNSSMQQPVTGN